MLTTAIQAAGAVLAFAAILGLIFLAIQSARREQRDADALRKSFEDLRMRLGGTSSGPLAFEVRRGPGLFRFEIEFDNDGDFRELRLAVTADRAAAVAEDAASPYRADAGQALRVRHLGPIVLRRETSMDRWGKLLLLNREVQIGEAELDRLVYVESYLPDSAVRRALSAPESRTAVVRILAAGWPRITLFEKSAAVVVSSMQARTGLFDPQAAESVMDFALQICRLLPPVHARSLGRPLLTWGRVAVAASALSLPMSWAVGLIAARLWPPLDPPRFAGLALAAILFAATSFATTIVVRGRADSLRYMAIAWLLQALSWVALGPGMLTAGNGLPDTSPKVTRTTKLLSLDADSARIEAWPPGRGAWDVSISETTYHALRGAGGEGIPVEVDQHVGALGWPWWSNLRPSVRR